MCDRCRAYGKCRCPCLSPRQDERISPHKLGYLLCRKCGHFVTKRARDVKCKSCGMVNSPHTHPGFDGRIPGLPSAGYVVFDDRPGFVVCLSCTIGWEIESKMNAFISHIASHQGAVVNTGEPNEETKMAKEKRESKPKPKSDKPRRAPKPKKGDGPATPVGDGIAGVRFYHPHRGKPGMRLWVWIRTTPAMTKKFADRKKTGGLSKAVRAAWEARPDGKVPTALLEGEILERAIVFPESEEAKIEKWVAAGNDFHGYVNHYLKETRA